MVKLFIDEAYDTVLAKRFIKEFNIAFAESNVEKILAMFAEDPVWELVGDKTYEGKEHIRAALEAMDLEQAQELTIHSILHDGGHGAANGVMLFEASKVAFCDVYTFSNDAAGEDMRIARLTSYGIDTPA